MKIKEISLSNFKSFKALRISSDHAFGDLNLIYGYNNSGKSNLLKFLHILFKRKYGGKVVTITENDGSTRTISSFTEGATNFWEGQLTNSQFLFNNNDTSVPIEFTVKFEEKKSVLPSNENLNKIYKPNNEFIITGKFVNHSHNVSNVILISSTLNGIEIFTRKGNDSVYFPAIKTLTGDSILFEELLKSFNDSVVIIDSDRYFSSESDNPDNRELNPKNFKNWLFQLYLDPVTYEKYNDLILSLEDFKPKASSSKPLLDSNFKNYPLNNIDLGFTKTKDDLSIMLNKIGRYPIESYGTGVQQIMYILAKFIYSNPKILLIEELELNLSPEYQTELLNYLKHLCDLSSNNLEQILFTSHSAYMVKNTKVDKFYAVTINDHGESNARLLPRTAAETYFDSPAMQEIFNV